MQGQQEVGESADIRRADDGQIDGDIRSSGGVVGERGQECAGESEGEQSKVRDSLNGIGSVSSVVSEEAEWYFGAGEESVWAYVLGRSSFVFKGVLLLIQL